MNKQWYVIHAYSGYENKVREALIERIERLGMSDLFGEIMVPSEEVVEMRGGQERKTQRKFFPGYVLVKIDLNKQIYHLLIVLRSHPLDQFFLLYLKKNPSLILNHHILKDH